MTVHEDLSVERHQLLAEIAEMYYLDGLSQEEIAGKVNLSRPSISRLLLDAREYGIVEINVNHPIPTVPSLEEALRDTFGLTDAHVVDRRGADDDEAIRSMGRQGAAVLTSIIRDGMILGLSWGTAVHGVIQALRPRRLPGVKVVQVIGGVGAPYRSIDGPEQCREAAQKFGAQHYYLNAPISVDSPEVAAALRNDHSIREVLELARQSDLALMGIGSTNPEVSTQYHSGYITFEDLRRLEKLGAVGSMCASFFDGQGNAIKAEWLDACAIGVNRADMDRFGTVVAVAGGRRKAAAILGAVRTGIIDILITDDTAAQEMLALPEKLSA